MGTAAYMSPEQVEGRPLDARSDIFSFGAVLHELLAGQRAFGGTTFVEILNAVLRADPGPLQAPLVVERLVRRCLEKRPEHRFQTMTEVKMALEGAARELMTKPAGDRPSIAVLPFADMSAGRDQEYFGDGLAEEIITALTHVEGLKVIARTSAFAFKGQHADIRRIAETLGVTHVLEGSVRKAGNRLRVTAQLVTAVDSSHLWSERYDRDLEDVFAIQDEIAQAIAAALRVQLSTAASPQRRYTPSLPAYDAFLKARHDLSKCTPESLTKGRAQLERAMTLDPGFAQAHVELGWCLFALVTETRMLPGEAAALMRTHVQQALEIEPSLPDAHAVLGLVAALDYNWIEAGRHLELAAVQAPVPALTRYFYSWLGLASLGRMSEAQAEIERAIQDDPLNFLWRAGLGNYLVGSGRLDEGETVLRQVLEVDDTFWLAHLWLAVVFFKRGLFVEALPFAEKAYSLVPGNVAAVGWLAGLLERTSDRRRAELLIGDLADSSTFGVPLGLTTYHCVRGDVDQAAQCLEKAIQQRDTRAPWILPRSAGGALVASAHWPRLARMMNLPPAAASL